MSSVQVHTVLFRGYGAPFFAEVRATKGGFATTPRTINFTGLPVHVLEKAAWLRELRVRVNAAVQATFGPVPACVVDLSAVLPAVVSDVGEPAGVGAQLDLAVAAAVSRLFFRKDDLRFDRTNIWFGELSLSGAIRPCRGAYAAAAYAALHGQLTFVTHSSHAAAAGKAGAPFVPALTLGGALEGADDLQASRAMPPAPTRKADAAACELQKVGPDPVVSKLCVVAALRLNALMVAPRPGLGTTIAARAVADLLPFGGPTAHETQVAHSLAGFELLIDRAPFRAPHHTVSRLGMVGNARRPGECALAHGGVLFLDEVIEFAPQVLNAVLDAQGASSVGRAWPGDFLLVAAGVASDPWSASRLSRLRESFPLLVELVPGWSPGQLAELRPLVERAATSPVVEAALRAYHRQPSPLALREAVLAALEVLDAGSAPYHASEADALLGPDADA